MPLSGKDYYYSIKKLKGDTNYSTWSYQMKTYLQHIGLWDEVIDTQTPYEKLCKTSCYDVLSALVFSIDPALYPVIEDISDPKVMWNTLKELYKSKLVDKVTALSSLLKIRYENFNGAEKYLNEFMVQREKLKKFGVDLSDDILAVLILVGLPNTFCCKIIYKLETSDNNKVTLDYVKARIIKEELRQSQQNRKS